MKKFKILKIYLCLLLFSACVKDTDFASPQITCNEPEITVTNTLQQVKEMYKYGGATVIETDVIIEGYVVSNDEMGNIYKTISIQDKPENPTAAIKIAIDQSDLYTKYNVGRKIFIKLKGLAIGYSYGSLQIGKAVGTEMDRIPSTEINNYIVRSCEVAKITPKIVNFNELNDSLLEMLISIENVQFNDIELGKTYGNLNNTQTVDRLLNIFSNNCDLSGNVILRNSGYADFKNELLPEGKGTITAIFSNYYDNFQLYIRDPKDLNFTEPRCDYSNLLPTISLVDVRKMYEGNMVEFGVDTNYIVEGFVISSDEHQNFEHKLVIQDAIENPTAGIQLLIDKEAIFETYPIGSKVLINLNKLYMTEDDGVLTIGFPKKTAITEVTSEKIPEFIYKTDQFYSIIPKEISISETSNKNLESTLVKVVDVQLTENELSKSYTFFSGENDGIRTLETCNEALKLSVFTNGKATFANDLFPKGHGSITGVLSSNLEIRKIDDVAFTDPFEVCKVFVPKIMITEIADPKNNVSARFVELYNAGESSVSLNGWKLNKYLNGSTSVSSNPVGLDGIHISAGGFAIIANTDFETVFNMAPNIVSTYISGNGDDVYELVDNTGKTIDIFGIIGQDGNATNWEYLDGGAVRNTWINNPSNLFNNSEWIIYSSATNNLISNPNSPKNAPLDYNPNYR
ncbi:DUF5689 domain-containing protein [Lutibacter sp. HS1-25]|uniref:DUF5689 domain-containing protein n=1 Tax=Lutibacter sp. HS1-25 TaxID=2485000 RepID=UPI0013E912A2|nr:DUF5689 domain-containing protein [Lutibacter sp. HS1-25]